MRIMLDHGKEQCVAMVGNIRAAAEKCGVLVPIILEQRSIGFIRTFLDKKRIMARVFNGPIHAVKGTEVVIYTKDHEDQAAKEPNAISLNATSFSELKTKEKWIVLFDMGKSSAVVVSVEPHKLKCVFRCSGSLFDNTIVHMYSNDHHAYNVYRLDGDVNEAIELPYKKTKEEYAEDVKMALELDVEYILTNGLEDTEGIVEIRRLLTLAKSKIKILAKIDNKWSISQIDSYIDVWWSSAPRVVDRRRSVGKGGTGDKDEDRMCVLDAEADHPQVQHACDPVHRGLALPRFRGRIPQPHLCRDHRYLHGCHRGLRLSHVHQRDTIWEVPAARYQGHAYALRINCVDDICCIAEEKFDYSAHYVDLVAKTKKPFDSLEAVSSSAVSTAFNMKAPVMIALTERGRGTRYLAKYKPYATVLALCQHPKVACQCGLLRSIFPLICMCTNLEDPIKKLIEDMKQEGILQPDQNIVLYSGLKEEKTGTENTMKAILIE